MCIYMGGLIGASCAVLVCTTPLAVWPTWDSLRWGGPTPCVCVWPKGAHPDPRKAVKVKHTIKIHSRTGRRQHTEQIMLASSSFTGTHPVCMDWFLQGKGPLQIKQANQIPLYKEAKLCFSQAKISSFFQMPIWIYR